jgi:hypothetical protein
LLKLGYPENGITNLLTCLSNFHFGTPGEGDAEPVGERAGGLRAGGRPGPPRAPGGGGRPGPGGGRPPRAPGGGRPGPLRTLTEGGGGGPRGILPHSTGKAEVNRGSNSETTSGSLMCLAYSSAKYRYSALPCLVREIKGKGKGQRTMKKN